MFFHKHQRSFAGHVQYTPGRMYTYGSNAFGQLGNNSTINSNYALVEVASAGNDDWTSVSCGYSHTAAIQSDGTLWTWGSNGSGELGDGTTTQRLTPVQIGIGFSWKKVFAGPNVTFAIRSDDLLFFTGSTLAGLGGSATTLTQVDSNTWQSVACRGSFVVILVRLSGEMYAIGSDPSYGTLGLGATTSVATMTRIGSSLWTTVVSGLINVAAFRSDGVLHVWGDRHYGQTGSSTNTIDATSPIAIPGGPYTFVDEMIYGYRGLMADGTMWTWGGDGNGAFGGAPVQLAVAGSWGSCSSHYSSDNTVLHYLDFSRDCIPTDGTGIVVVDDGAAIRTTRSGASFLPATMKSYSGGEHSAFIAQ